MFNGHDRNEINSNSAPDSKLRAELPSGPQLIRSLSFDNRSDTLLRLPCSDASSSIMSVFYRLLNQAREAVLRKELVGGGFHDWSINTVTFRVYRYLLGSGNSGVEVCAGAAGMVDLEIEKA
jgi:hypothetical protein